MFKEFKVRDILPPINIKKFAKKPESEGTIPFVSCQTTNNGIATYCGEIPEVNHCITVSTNGNCFDCFWHNYPIIPSSDVEVLSKDGITDDEKISLYLCGLLAPNTILYSYSNKPKNGKVFETKLTLPVIEHPDPDHEYTVDDIDWQYMRDRITELERDRITELDAYLQATGLNDYELTEDDKKILSLSAKRASDKEGDLEDAGTDEVRFGEFAMHDIFEPLSVKKAVKANVRNYRDNEFCVPVVYAKFGDNGIMYWGRKSEFTTYNNVLSIVYNGVISAGKCYAQEDETGILAESYLIRYKYGEIPFLANLYMSQVIEHKIYPLYSRENLAIWNNRVENDIIELPITSSGTPDFDYMERYIRAMEKVVIADVVKYKDNVIETTKKVVGDKKWD